MVGEFEVVGGNDNAPFTLKLHRGEGMLLLAMNWKDGQPPDNFVGFGIEYQVPGNNQFFVVHNRLSFDAPTGPSDATFPSLDAPIQKFRWVHFPYEADQTGAFTYRVTPVFMDDNDKLSYGEPQTADVELARETYPDQLNVAFTRGFVSSQAFVDMFEKDGPISDLLPTDAKLGLGFTPTHPDKDTALPWMGFEARAEILKLLDDANADPTAQVKAIAYDFNEPEIVDKFKSLGNRLTIIIDDSKDHKPADSAETAAAAELAQAGAAVKRQHMGNLQHNKVIVVNGSAVQKAICGSTNFSWRGLYVQNNNAVVLTGASAIQPFLDAFDAFWANDSNDTASFGSTASATWTDLGLAGIDAQVTFSPHSAANSVIAGIGTDITDNSTSSVFYSLAFLGQTTGPIRDAIKAATERDDLFVYGIADNTVGGINVQKGGNKQPVHPDQLGSDTPPPFKPEPSGGQGIRMHHKFVVIDFDKPTARVYLGSYNFSNPADGSNGENLLLIKDRRVAVAYMVEAVRIFDHYEFRLRQHDAQTAVATLQLQKPPQPGGVAWWSEDWTDPQKSRDRLIFA